MAQPDDFSEEATQLIGLIHEVVIQPPVAQAVAKVERLKAELEQARAELKEVLYIAIQKPVKPEASS